MGYYYSLLSIKVVLLKHKLFLLLRWCKVNVETDVSSFRSGLVMCQPSDLWILQLLYLNYTEMEKDILLSAMHLISKIFGSSYQLQEEYSWINYLFILVKAGVFIACRLQLPWAGLPSSCCEQGYPLFTQCAGFLLEWLLLLQHLGPGARRLQ